MKVFLMYPDRDFKKQGLPFNAQDLVEDLGLKSLLESMSRGDEYLLKISRSVLLNPVRDPEVIRYRQEVMRDVLENPEVVREIYQIPIDIEKDKREKWWGIFGWRNPTNILSGARKTLEALLGYLKKLRKIADENVGRFRSRGFRRFFSMIQKELDDEYLEEIAVHVEKLKFQKGVLLSVSIGEGNEGRDYVLSKPIEKGFFQKLLGREKVYSFKLHPRDESGAQVLDNLRSMGLSRAATVVACAAKHIEGFFKKLREELAFYIGSLNLSESLGEIGVKTTFPDVRYDSSIRIKGLVNIDLAFSMGGKVVSNDLFSDGKELFLITGANRGGKTTFLRSIGQAYLMMQSGMFVAAEEFSSRVHKGIFTHFRREEDENLRMGKFEEELSRMSEIIDHMESGSLMLFNEFLSSTNEREGSEIAYQIVKALLEKGVRIFYVTLMYDLVRRFFDDEAAMFLKADRTPSGKRTFKITKGEPTPTSHGLDIYARVFPEESVSRKG